LTFSEERARTLRWIFFGAQGLRTAWGVLLFVLVFELTEAMAIATLSHYVSLKPKGPIPPILALMREACELVAVAAATWVAARFEHKSMLSYGFTGRHRFGRLGAGAVWGLASLSVLVLVLWKTGSLVFDGRSLNGLDACTYGIIWLFVFLLVGLFEEALLRGYLQYKLSQSIGFWWAAAVLCVAFALLHVRNGGESGLGLLAVGLGGLFFCISLWFTKSLWWAVGFHAGWDWGQSFLYGTPNSGLVMKGHLLTEHPSGDPLFSGGFAGPEASVFLPPLFVVAGLCMSVWWGKIRPVDDSDT